MKFTTVTVLLCICSFSMSKTVIEMTQEWVKEEQHGFMSELRNRAHADEEYRVAESTSEEGYRIVKALDLDPMNLVANGYEQEERAEMEDFKTLVEILSKPRIPAKYRTGFRMGPVNDFQWQSCGASGDLVTIDELTVQPDKLVFPGDVTVSAKGKINSDIKAPISLDFVLQKKIGAQWMTVPCSLLGGCHYDDLCPLLDSMCPSSMPCRCPFKAGPIDVPATKQHIDRQIPEGDYKLHLSAMNSDKEVFCLDVQMSIG